MSSNIQPLIPGRKYHVFNRAVGNEILFRKEEDYRQWIDCFKKYVTPLADIYSYCLLPNHYHLLLQINEEAPVSSFSKAMANMANAYCKWYNWHNKRMGSLFIRPFKRKQIEDDHQFAWTCWYIHRNPMHHGYTKDWATWKFSSFSAYFVENPSLLNRDYIIDFFGSKEALQKHPLLFKYHRIVNLIAIE